MKRQKNELEQYLEEFEAAFLQTLCARPGIVKFDIENRKFEGVRCSNCGKIFGLSNVK